MIWDLKYICSDTSSMIHRQDAVVHSLVPLGSVTLKGEDYLVVARAFISNCDGNNVELIVQRLK